jgi:hypothetical protein
LGDKAFEWLTLAMAFAVVVLMILVGWELWSGSCSPSKNLEFISHYINLGPGGEQFGALPSFTERWFLL